MSEFRIDQIKNQNATGGPNVAGITTFTGTSGIVMPSGLGVPDNILPGLRGSTFTAWQGLTATRAAVTKHAAIAPDGTQTADQIANADNSNNAKNIYSYQNFDTAGTYVGEIFFKRVSSSTTPYVSMYLDASAANESYVVFNLRDGIVETDYNRLTEHSDTSKNTQYLMESVGNGWYRCAIMVKTISTTNRPFSFWPPNEDLDAVDPTNPYFTGDTTNNKIYAWHPLLYRVEPNKNISEVISNIDLRIGNTTPGAIRFNTDSMKLEYYHGGPLGIGTDTTGEWVQITTDTPDIQTGGTRGVFAGGYIGGNTNVIQYANVDSTGNTIDFGNLSGTRRGIGACASRTRGIFAGGTPLTNTIEFITIASTGNATNFGDCLEVRRQRSGLSNSTRGLIAGGYNPSPSLVWTNTIEYITIAQTGDSVNFGDLSGVKGGMGNGCSNGTRGIFGGGYTPSYVNVIEYVAINTLGNTADFGDLTSAKGIHGCSSNSVRALWGGGGSNPGTTAIDYVTISTLGNGTDFGDLTQARTQVSGCSSPTRSLFAGGTPGTIDTIDYVQIMSIGNAVDFGNLIAGNQQSVGCSNGHGGLG